MAERKSTSRKEISFLLGGGQLSKPHAAAPQAWRTSEPQHSAPKAPSPKHPDVDTAAKSTSCQRALRLAKQKIKSQMFPGKWKSNALRQKIMGVLIPVFFVIFISVLSRNFGIPKLAFGGFNKLAVKGILYDKDNPSAIIGGRVVHGGDEVAGATIVKINEDCVEFEIDGERFMQEVEH